jgi:hypothetical protein
MFAVRHFIAEILYESIRLSLQDRLPISSRQTPLVTSAGREIGKDQIE